jgi:hypothetical protein
MKLNVFKPEQSLILGTQVDTIQLPLMIQGAVRSQLNKEATKNNCKPTDFVFTIEGV